MDIKRVTGLLIAAAVFSASLCGCTEKQAESDLKLVELADWQSYRIVRPDSADRATIDAATSLVKALEERTGVKPELETDWIKRGESIPTGTKEILIGATNRPESVETFRYNDFTVKFVGDRLVINGGSGEAVQTAVDWFAENCLSDGKVYLPAGGYSYAGDYPLGNVRLGGVPLSEFSVTAADGAFESVADELAEELFAKTGLRSTSDGHRIIICTDESVSLFDAVVKPDGNDLKLAVNPSGLDVSEAVVFF